MQELLASYYGMQRGADRSSDVESTNFDAKAYVGRLLRNEKVETLLRKDDEMVSELKVGDLEGEGTAARVAHKLACVCVVGRRIMRYGWGAARARERTVMC